MWMTLGILFALICIALLGVMIYDSTRFVTVSYRLTVPHLKKRRAWSREKWLFSV